MSRLSRVYMETFAQKNIFMSIEPLLSIFHIYLPNNVSQPLIVASQWLKEKHTHLLLSLIDDT